MVLDDGDEESKEAKPATQYAVDIASLPTIAMEDVESHKTKEDCWTVVDGLVYNITPFVPFHPGGKMKIMQGAGKEASTVFRKCEHQTLTFSLSQTSTTEGSI